MHEKFTDYDSRSVVDFLSSEGELYASNRSNYCVIIIAFSWSHRCSKIAGCFVYWRYRALHGDDVVLKISIQAG
jgi:hypothetical protein